MAMCAKLEFGAAPCQCLVSGATYTTSPGLSSTGLFAPLLVVAAPAHGGEDLAGLVVNMPVVAAARLERDVGNVDFLARDQRRQIALPDEILGVCVVRRAQRERAGIGDGAVILCHNAVLDHGCLYRLAAVAPQRRNVWPILQLPAMHCFPCKKGIEKLSPYYFDTCDWHM